MKKFSLSTLFLIFLIPLNAQTSGADVLQNLEQNNNSDKLTATTKSATRLFGAKDDLTTVILIVPSGSTVDVLSIDSTYFKVVYEDNEGYIFVKHATLNKQPVQPSQSKQVDVRQPSQNGATPNPGYQPDRQTRQEQSSQQERGRFSYLENKYGTSIATQLITGKIWKGMSGEMVKDSWGNPRKIDRVISGNTIKEEWTFANTWLYLENDVLLGWGAIRQR